MFVCNFSVSKKLTPYRVIALPSKYIWQQGQQANLDNFCPLPRQQILTWSRSRSWHLYFQKETLFLKFSTSQSLSRKWQYVTSIFALVYHFPREDYLGHFSKRSLQNMSGCTASTINTSKVNVRFYDLSSYFRRKREKYHWIFFKGNVCISIRKHFTDTYGRLDLLVAHVTLNKSHDLVRRREHLIILVTIWPLTSSTNDPCTRKVMGQKTSISVQTKNMVCWLLTISSGRSPEERSCPVWTDHCPVYALKRHFKSQ